MLWQYKLHLNAGKYVFGVGAGKFLGYLITNRRIKVNPDQINAVQHLKPPKKSEAGIDLDQDISYP